MVELKFTTMAKTAAGSNSFPRCLLWLSVGLTLVVMSGSLLQMNAANAQGHIFLERGEIGDDAAFIREYLATEYADTDDKLEEFYVGRYDLNNDGKLELLVVLYEFGYCGSAGCEMIVFERIDGSWSALAVLYVYGPMPGHGGKIWLQTKDEGAAYLTILGFHIGMRWDGEAYRWFCIGNECDKADWQD